MRLRSDFRTEVTTMNRLHRESGEERAEPINSFTTVSKVAPFFLKFFMVELVSGMSGWRSRNLSQSKEEGHEMNIFEPCLFSKVAVREEPPVDGGTIAPGGFVGCVLLEVDDQLMGGPGRDIMLSWRDYGKGSNLEMARVVGGRAVLFRRTPIPTVACSGLQG